MKTSQIQPNTGHVLKDHKHKTDCIVKQGNLFHFSLTDAQIGSNRSTWLTKQKLLLKIVATISSNITVHLEPVRGLESNKH